MHTFYLQLLIFLSIIHFLYPYTCKLNREHKFDSIRFTFLILISEVNYDFVIERRTSENVHFSRGFFSNGASTRSGTEIVRKETMSCVSDFVHFRVSLLYVVIFT